MVPGSGAGTSLEMSTTVQPALIQTMSNGKCMFFIQKLKPRSTSKMNSIPVPGASAGRSDSPCCRSADVSANSTGNTTPSSDTAGTGASAVAGMVGDRTSVASASGGDIVGAVGDGASVVAAGDGTSVSAVGDGISVGVEGDGPFVGAVGDETGIGVSNRALLLAAGDGVTDGETTGAVAGPAVNGGVGTVPQPLINRTSNTVGAAKNREARNGNTVWLLTPITSIRDAGRWKTVGPLVCRPPKNVIPVSGKRQAVSDVSWPYASGA